MQPTEDSRLYKYVGPSYLGKVLAERRSISIRCSLPREFSDPYELFLTIRFDTEPELLAYYADLIGEIVQRPTTCFSRRPDVVPMWAHYAEGLRGAVLELDESRLSAVFPKSSFGDVEYREKPDPRLNAMLEFAHGTQKFRHSRHLILAVLGAAYFTKSATWAYELERRMIVDTDDLVEREGVQLLLAPTACATAMIAGPRASEETKALLRASARAAGCGYFEMRIGRSSATPYFVTVDGEPYRFSAGRLTAAEYYCERCHEPLESGEECSWCRITDSMRTEASRDNPLRLLEDMGMLEGYFESARKIDDSLES
jgi:hypothetical protein